MPLSAILSTRSNRRQERVATNAEAVCRRGDERQHVRVLDLSVAGARLQTLRRLREGQHIWLKLPMIEPREAIVVWVETETAGCEFLEPLHPAIFAVVSRAAGAPG